MSGAQINGGPAFPRVTDSHVDREETVFDGPEGMTLRDYFAAMALPKVMALCFMDTREPDEEPPAYFARKSYELADAMLKARSA